jgi:hypothetical protein
MGHRLAKLLPGMIEFDGSVHWIGGHELVSCLAFNRKNEQTDVCYGRLSSAVVRPGTTFQRMNRPPFTSQPAPFPK